MRKFPPKHLPYQSSRHVAGSSYHTYERVPGVIAHTRSVVYPLDTVKTRLQALPPSSLDAEASEQTQIEKEDPDLIFENVRQQPEAVPKALLHRLRRWQMLSLLIRILKTEGLGGAFKGFSASMINTFSTREYSHAACPYLH